MNVAQFWGSDRTKRAWKKEGMRRMKGATQNVEMERRAKHEGGEIHRGFMNIWMPVTNDDMYLTGMEVNGFL